MMLWVEKYRPKSLDDMILADDNKAALLKFLKEGEIPHLLFSGISGSGKTTIARILIDQLNCSVLSLNASDDRGIDVVRDRIKPFLMTQTASAWKIVFLDEADSMTPESHFALRNIMERFSAHGRFILTANHPEKIHEAVRSRCQELHFRALDRKLVTRLVIKILKDQSIEFDPADVVRLIDDHYPDVRKIINQTERRVQGTKLVYAQEQTVEAQLLTLLQAGQLRPIRELLLSTKPEFTALYRYLFDVVVGQYEGVQSPVATARRREAALAISEYAYRDAIVPDRELQFAACCLKLMDLK
jgi:DNA polymerase III delta prime subunit